MEAFELRHLSFAYPGQAANAVEDLSLTIQQGEFLVLCGSSGCGKSTLLRQLKPTLSPCGRRSGRILFEGQPLETLGHRAQSQKIGFVQQSPDAQLVTDKVWHELAFGLESLGYETPVIRRRVAEMASFFGIQTWFYRDVTELSGGQKQLLNLASVMVMQPDVLILDEPTAQLDPIAAGEFLSILGRLNRELGTTVILAEHRLEEALPLASSVAVMEHGRLLCAGAPREVGILLKNAGHPIFPAMPVSMRVWAAVESAEPCPVTIRDGQKWLTDFHRHHSFRALPEEPRRSYPGGAAVFASELWFRYGKALPDVVRGLSLTAQKGELLALLGGNGTGKTTTLKLLAGLLKPCRGTLRLSGSVGLLPQEPQALFVGKTVQEDLFEILSDKPIPPEEQAARVKRTVELCRLEGLLNRHPYDLSGGERQRAALAKLLLTEPDILLLDEPTKGLDAGFKQIFAGILQALAHRGVCILMVSHDLEFCARYAHRCVLFFDGSAAAEGSPRAFFSGNRFYTTAANRMARSLLPEAVTAEDVIAACGGTLPPPPPEEDHSPPEPAANIPEEAPPRRSRRSFWQAGAFFLPFLLLIPLTLLIGTTYLKGKNYSLLSFLILLEAMLPFFLSFERQKPQPREAAVIAALCALGVAGRAAFFMLPQFKPVMALTIVSGAALGGEAGFMVGALTMLVSNVLFGQGPWTPWQMFSMGIIGFLAGILFRRGFLRRSRSCLCVFGALSALFIYGGIMNPAAALMWSAELNWKILAAYYLSGFPMDCVQAAATCLFLWFGAEPLLEKLERLKSKYGLFQAL